MASWSMGGREQTKLRGRSATALDPSFRRGKPEFHTPEALKARAALEYDDMVGGRALSCSPWAQQPAVSPDRLRARGP